MSVKFTHRNDGFVCQHCGQNVAPATKTCRNHCTACLYSLHVDVYPGDRAAGCQGLMAPVAINFKGGLPVSIEHKCTKCGYVGKNKIAPDDNRSKVAEMLEKS